MEQSQTNNNQQNNNVGYTFDPSKINKDFLLDAVTFSDDEDTNQPINLDANTYNKEMQKIETLYNPIPIDEDDGGTMNTYTGTKNEILEKDIKEFPKPFELSPNDKMTLCGHVNDIVEGKILIDNCIPKHLEPISAKLREAGAIVEENESSVRVIMNERPKSFSIKTMPYPGFPTDMQPQTSLVLAIADGTGVIIESVWESRFQYTDELSKMGAQTLCTHCYYHYCFL